MNIFKFFLSGIFAIMATIVVADLPVTPPAIIWGVELPKSPSIFEFLNTKMLVDMLRPLQEEHMIIAYFATELTAKDFSCLEPDCFQFLRQVKPFNYYIQVHRPLVALQKVSNVIWDEREKLLELECQKNEIHGFNFTDRNLKDHDNLMKTVSNNLKSCPVIHIYTAHSEEIFALKRRHDRFYLKNDRSQLARENLASRPVTSTVLRHSMGIVSVEKILLAEELKKGLLVNYKRTEILVNNDPLRLNPVDGRHISNGFYLVISTSMGSLSIEVLPTMGNFRISRILFHDNITYIPRDLLFYSKKFSFCCRCITAYSHHGSRLSLFMFYLDVVLNDQFSALDPDYIPKPCWLCEAFLTPGLTQGIFTIFILIFILGMGASWLLNIGRQKILATSTHPELYVKGSNER